jgi:hypothetical protein
MALRINATGQHYTRTTGTFITSAAHTNTVWACIDVDRNAAGTIYGNRNTAGTEYSYLYNANADGTTMTFELGTTGDPVSLTGPNMTVGLWYFFGWGRSGTGANQVFLMYAALTSPTLTVLTGSSPVASVTYTEEIVGSNQFDTAGGWHNGRLTALKSWNIGLTQAQIEAERWFYLPQRWANLFTFHPFLTGGATTPAQHDWSGNTHTLSGGTGSVTEAGPPLAWAPRRLPHGRVSAPPVDTTVTAMPPDAILASTNLTGAVGDVDESPASPDGNWLTASSATAATDLRVSFGTPVANPFGAQNFRIWVRKTTGAQTPTLTAELRQSDTLRTTVLTDTPVTSLTGEVQQGDWPASALSGTLDGSDVELRLVSTPGSTAPTLGAMAAYSGTGQAAAVTNATITTTVTPANPSTVNAGDLLILQVLTRNEDGGGNGAGPATISGWTAFAGNPYGGTNFSRQSLYWRIAGAGEASATVSVTCTGGTTNDLVMARIYRFIATDGFETPPIEAIATNAGTTATLAAPANVTPTGLNRRAVCFGAIATSDATIGSMTGETAGNWTEAVTGNSTIGGDGTLNVQTADASAGTAISGGSIAFTLSTSAHWNTVGCCLVPASIAGAAVNTVEVGAVEWNARYLTPVVGEGAASRLIGPRYALVGAGGLVG